MLSSVTFIIIRMHVLIRLVGCIRALTKDVEMEINHILVAKKESNISYFLAIEYNQDHHVAQ